MNLILDLSTVKPEESAKLGISQCVVLAALRQLKTRQQVARFFGRQEKSIEMIILRIRHKGVSV